MIACYLYRTVHFKDECVDKEREISKVVTSCEHKDKAKGKAKNEAKDKANDKT